MAHRKEKTSDWLSEFDPTPDEIQAIIHSRKIRGHQRKARGSKRSPCDEAENALMLLALEAGEVSEGIAAKVLAGGDRVKLREMRHRAVALGRSLTHGLRILGGK
jgi:hypothetical protein